jgi:hypothetical protein
VGFKITKTILLQQQIFCKKNMLIVRFLSCGVDYQGFGVRIKWPVVNFSSKKMWDYLSSYFRK